MSDTGIRGFERLSCQGPEESRTRLYLDDPEGPEEEKKIDLGVELVTKTICSGIRHYIDFVVLQEPLAAKIKLKNKDEIMIVNGVQVFNEGHKFAVTEMLRLKINEDLDVVVRRMPGPIHWDAPDDERRYNEIKAVVRRTEERIIPSATNSLVDTDEIQFMFTNITYFHVKYSENHYLRFVGGSLECANNLLAEDPSYKLAFVNFNGYSLKDKSPKYVGEAVMIRSCRASKGKLVYVVAENEVIKLEELCKDLPDGKPKIDKRISFWIRENPPITAFELMSEKDEYLAVNNDQTGVTLLHLQSDENKRYEKHHKFSLVPVGKEDS